MVLTVHDATVGAFLPYSARLYLILVSGKSFIVPPQCGRGQHKKDQVDTTPGDKTKQNCVVEEHHEVYQVNKEGNNTVPCGAPVLVQTNSQLLYGFKLVTSVGSHALLSNALQ